MEIKGGEDDLGSKLLDEVFRGFAISLARIEAVSIGAAGVTMQLDPIAPPGGSQAAGFPF